MKAITVFALGVGAGVMFAPTQITAQSSDFSSMAVEEDSSSECVVPRPPKALAETAYIRNGYAPF